jgi:hypothetical protein
MYKGLLLIFLGLVLLLVPTQAAHAQGCSEPKPICNEFWTGLSAIFIGRVISATPLPPHPKEPKLSARPDNLKALMIVRFVVEKSYRKYEKRQLEVETLGSGEQRPFSFEVGVRYLVFAEWYPLRSLSHQSLLVYPCSRTRLVTQAQEDIDYLESVFKLNPAADILNFRNEPVIHVGTLQGRPISLPKPPYPNAAKAAHASGSIPVLILLDESGRVIKAKSLCGDPLLTEAAEASAWQARFSPIKVSGKEVKVSTIVVYNFVSQ